MAVIAAVDDTTEDADVVEVGRDLADAYGDELVVLHVMSQEIFEERHDSRSEYYRDTAAEDAAAVAGRIASSASNRDELDVTVTTRGRVGNAVEEMLEEADHRDARYLVVGGRKRTPVGKAVFGSITQSVLLNAESAVVTVMHD